jgi:putative component of membrane protein insertase Oxa1/YidC/SpoIIIJ protein YidD
MKQLALAAITLYQRYLSPLKGYSCAFRVHTGRDGCSAYGKRVISRHGLRVGLILLDRRLAACCDVHHRYQQFHPKPIMTTRRQAQAGFVDCSCDLPDIKCLDGLQCLDVLDCFGNCPDTKSCRRRCGWRRQPSTYEGNYVNIRPGNGGLNSRR